LSSLAELEEAAREGRFENMKGLGASLQAKVLRGMEMQREAQDFRRRHGKGTAL
jgi:DNA polymerase/3'-5' exonuclease PolX